MAHIILRTVAVALLIGIVAAMVLTGANGTVPQFVMVAVMALVIGAPVVYGFAHAADEAEALKA